MLRNQIKKLSRQKEGFTLIEIVLVLAIAGLILLIVFLAVAGAQRSRRDTGRQDVVNRAVAERAQLVANGIVAPTAAQVATATGALPDGVTGVAASGSCGVEGAPGAYASINTIGIDASSACIKMENGAVYVKNYL